MFLLEFDGNVEKHDGKYVKTLTVSVSLGGKIINQLRLLLQTFQYFSFFFCKFIYIFWAVLGLRCCVRAFSSCVEWGLLFIAVRGLLIAVASLVAEHGL